MKSLIIILLFFGFAYTSYSQDEPLKEDGNLEINKLPEIVISKAEKDFSTYIHDNNPDGSVRKIQEKFVAYQVGKDYEGFEEYLLVMKLKKGSLAATYNEKGKLTHVVENYRDVIPPYRVMLSVHKAFPQWRIISDKLLYKQSNGNITENHYSLRIKKDKEIKKLLVRPDGEIIKVF
ncbi:hypothetical protein EOD40_02785 [Flavobacterium sufflavum]|uniref:Nicotinate-nucleotide adenylyltransferase n=1 Tax=Flavobacterium sufflavum TaxID=1921138 RepID=A0A437L414_9FLAO|nr:hypothetical protein [Flavobacterium sufflavum]RVT80054.1 hypothetical protein EOD40_02785 [Flavobacterium sufflavum]